MVFAVLIDLRMVTLGSLLFVSFCFLSPTSQTSLNNTNPLTQCSKHRKSKYIGNTGAWANHCCKLVWDHTTHFRMS